MFVISFSALSLALVWATDAFVLFEGSVARTSVVRDALNPRWAAADPRSYRAFKLPVTSPYSVLYVCINDYDGFKSSEMHIASSDAPPALVSRGSSLRRCPWAKNTCLLWAGTRSRS